MKAIDTAVLAYQLAQRGMFPNARVLPSMGKRFAVVARQTAGAPWSQVESVYSGAGHVESLQQAVIFADSLNVSEADRVAAILQSPEPWDPEESALFPMVGQIWTHKSGRLYIVEGMSNLYDQGRYPANVVYRGEDGLVFNKPFLHWYDSMTFKADAMSILKGQQREWWTHDYRKDMTA